MVGTADQLLGAAAGVLLESGVAAQVGAVRVLVENQVGDRVDQAAQQGALANQRFLDLLLLGDVLGDADDADQPALAIEERHLARQNPARFTSGTRLVFDLVEDGLAALDDLLLVLVETTSHFGRIEIEIGLADDLLPVGRAHVSGVRIIDPREAHVPVFEVNQVRDVVHQGMEHVAFPGQLGLDPLPLGNVDDEAFQDWRIVFARGDGPALLPDPFLFAGPGLNAIGTLEGLPGSHRLLNLVPDTLPITRVNQLGVGNVIIADQIAGRVAGQRESTVAHEFHCPVRFVAAPVGHAGQIAHQRCQGALHAGHLSGGFAARGRRGR